MTIKDSIITEGVRSTWGMKMFEHHVARQDAPTVERLRAAGAIVIAKTNTPEMTMDYDCDNPVFGPTNIRGIASACPADRVAARRRRWRLECRRWGWDRIIADRFGYPRPSAAWSG